jgi:hypothetical protein
MPHSNTDNWTSSAASREFFPRYHLTCPLPPCPPLTHLPSLPKVQSGISLVTHLSSGADDTEICLKFLSVKNLLDSVLDCSLAEQLSSRPVPLIFPSEFLHELTHYGYVGSPSAPVALRTSFLQDGSRILLTWRQKHFPLQSPAAEGREGQSCSSSTNRREDIVRFVIQRGVTDLIVTTATAMPLSSSSSSTTATDSTAESISTASVPASVSVDRVDPLAGEGEDEGELHDDSPYGFIQFESIGEITFEAGTLLPVAPHPPSPSLPPQHSSVASSRPLDREPPHPRGSSPDLTLGIPPFASSASASTTSLPAETSGSGEEEKGEGAGAGKRLPLDSSQRHSDHSFHFDSFDYPLKLLHFRVKAINRDGHPLPPPLPSPPLTSLCFPPGLSSDWSATTCIRTPNSFRKEFTHSPSLTPVFDSSGLLFYLGTVAATKHSSSAPPQPLALASSSLGASPRYLNPQTVGMVRVSMSSVLNSSLSQPSQIIDPVPVGYNCTGPSSSPSLPLLTAVLTVARGRDAQPVGLHRFDGREIISSHGLRPPLLSGAPPLPPWPP